MTDASRDDDANVGATFNWWWIVGGGVISGLSLFSLVTTLNDIGLNGVVALVHEQYVRVRDVAFTPIVWAVRSFAADWQITPQMHDVAFALSVFLAVMFRSVIQARRIGLATVAGVLTIPILSFIVLGFAYNAWSILIEIGRDAASVIGVLFIILVVAVFGFVIVRQPAAERYVITTFALNALACAVVAAVLLLLNAVL